MSTSSPSLKPLQQEQTHESDVVSEEILKEETPNQPDPGPKSDPETIPPPQSIPDLEDNSQEEEDDEEEEGEEVDEGQEQENPAISSGMSLPQIADSNVSVPDVTLKSPSNDPNPNPNPNPRWVGNKRKKGKGKGKGKGKSNVKKRQAIEEKLQTLMTNLNPISFAPHKIFDFPKHEKLLKKLGLWDFVHIDFDGEIRVDLIAQLVATYKPNIRASYVNGFRIMVNRADLARAFKLPLKKEKANVGGVEVDLDSEVLLDDSIRFINDFVSNWVLLHEDMWEMPSEVLDWLKLIKEGHPEKVDWAGLFWFMVKKELKQGGHLRDCYYASHLQHLIKFQREEAFLRDEPVAEAIELGAEAKLVAEPIELDAEAKPAAEAIEPDAEAKEKEEKEEDGVNEGDVKEDGVIGGPSTELTLGQDGEKEEGTKDVEMMDSEKCKDSDEEQGQWLLNGKNSLGEHFMQPCGADNAGEFGDFEERKDEEDEEMDGEEDGEEEEDKFHDFPNDEGDGFTGNLLQMMEGNQMPFGSQDQLDDPSSNDMQHNGSTSFFNNAGKRLIEHDNHIDDNKRLRISDSWDHKALDLGTCLEKVKQTVEQARLLHAEKEQAMEELNLNQQVLLHELQKRDNVIEHMHKTRLEEIQKKDAQIYRLERELYLMGNVLEGYRRAIKETQKAFAEYRERAQLPEEPTYRDVGPGGLMLSAAEIERLQKKQEEEFKMNCLIVEDKMKEVENDNMSQFEGYFEKINVLEKKLTGLEANAKELSELHAKRKTPQTEEKVRQVAEPMATLETEKKVRPVAEPMATLETEKKVPEVAEPMATSETEEKVPEVAEPMATLETEEKVPEVAEPMATLETEEKVLEMVEPLPIQETIEKVPEVPEPLPSE